jgi:pentose-5-phosphate-3-epimerase
MERFAQDVSLIQIDVMDGKFVTSKDWPYKISQSVDLSSYNKGDGMVDLDKEFLKVINQEEGLPCWQDLDVEVDLMVQNPEVAAEQWIAAGAARVIVHFESAAPAVIESVLKSIKEKGIETGLAIDLATPIETVIDFYNTNQDRIDIVQFMGIERVGYQEQPFSEKTLVYVSSFKKEFPDSVVSVDGGVSLDTIDKLAEAGIDKAIIGSALSEKSIGSSVTETIDQFERVLAVDATE